MHVFFGLQYILFWHICISAHFPKPVLFISKFSHLAICVYPRSWNNTLVSSMHWAFWSVGSCHWSYWQMWRFSCWGCGRFGWSWRRASPRNDLIDIKLGGGNSNIFEFFIPKTWGKIFTHFDGLRTFFKLGWWWFKNHQLAKNLPKGFCFSQHFPYCWWTKSCTTNHDDYPIIYRVLTIPGGAGFCPSTVWLVGADAWHLRLQAFFLRADVMLLSSGISSKQPWPRGMAMMAMAGSVDVQWLGLLSRWRLHVPWKLTNFPLKINGWKMDSLLK